MKAPTVVLYHNIKNSESSFEKGLNVTTSPDVFEAHLRYYQKDYDIIDLSTLLAGRLPPRPLLITFDDCYRSVLEAVEKQLKPKGLPSLFFINPGLIAGGISLDNWIAWACGRHGVAPVATALGAPDAPSAATLISGRLSRCSAKERASVRQRLAESFPVPANELATRSPMLEAEDLARFVELGVEIGNHTANHVHCGALDPDEYDAELIQSKLDLERLSGRPVRSFSIAYGDERDLTAPVLSRLHASGHEAVFLVHARSNITRPAPDVWYRVSFRSEPARQLPVRLGVFPLLRTVRDHFRR